MALWALFFQNLSIRASSNCLEVVYTRKRYIQNYKFHCSVLLAAKDFAAEIDIKTDLQYMVPVEKEKEYNKLLETV